MSAERSRRDDIPKEGPRTVILNVRLMSAKNF